jgi:hypothetical protein
MLMLGALMLDALVMKLTASIEISLEFSLAGETFSCGFCFFS